ncbi:uncharacterized protein PEZ65_007340 [Lycodopsis pacificus]
MLGKGGCGSVFAGFRKVDNLPNGISVEVAVMLKLADTSDETSAPVSLLDWYKLDQELILVLERPIPAKDLLDHVNTNGGTLDEYEAKVILKQLIDAAIDLEEKKIFHRDIKLENMLIETSSEIPRVRLIDFGLSCFFKKISCYHVFFAEFEAKYQQQDLLGKGGCGSVFAGFRKVDNLPVAIKHVPNKKIHCKHNGISVEVAVMLKLADTSDETSAPVSLLDWYKLDQELILVLERPIPAKDLLDHVNTNGGTLIIMYLRGKKRARKRQTGIEKQREVEKRLLQALEKDTPAPPAPPLSEDELFMRSLVPSLNGISVEVAVMLKLADTSDETSAPVSLLDWYKLDQELILVLERPIPAKDLLDHVNTNGGTLDEYEAKVILKQLIDAAIDLEEKKIFHRDIKLENMLIETSSEIPRVRLIDFGLSCFFKKISCYHVFFGTEPPQSMTIMNGISVEVAVMLKLADTSDETSAPVSLLDWYKLDQELILVLERPIPAKDLLDHVNTNGGTLIIMYLRGQC